jgi:hypothetical protein
MVWRGGAGRRVRARKRPLTEPTFGPGWASDDVLNPAALTPVFHDTF